MAAIPGRNVIHGADSVESAEKEISIWFGSEDGNVAEWDPAIMPWIDDGTAEKQGGKKECSCEPCTCDPCTCGTKKEDEEEGEKEDEKEEAEDEGTKEEESEEADAAEE